MHKIAIQLSGQIRYWHKSYNDWVEFKSSLQERGFDVDLHICGWEDEYTKELEYYIFTTSNLIPINKDIVKENSKSDGNWSRNQQPLSLLPYSYLQYWGGRFRRLYQKQNNVDYDFIILTRPDVYNLRQGRGEAKQLSLSWEEFSKSFFTIFTDGIENRLGGETKSITRVCSDLLVMGTEESINLFCNGFLHCYLQESQSFYAGHHNLPGYICMKTNLHSRTYPNTFHPQRRKKIYEEAK